MDQRVLADLGWTLDREEIIERFVGKSEANMVTQIENLLGIKLAADWDSYYKVWYQDAFDRDLRPVSGIVRAARSAGMHAFGYAGGVTRAEKLAGETTTVFTDTAELPQLLLA